MPSAYDLLYGAESPSEGGPKKGGIAWAKDFDAMFGLDKVEPYVESPGMLQRLRRGFGNTVDSVKAATAAESGDRDELASVISQNAKDELPQSTVAKGIYKNLAPAAEEAKKAEGFVDNVAAYAKLGGKAVSEFASNPKEFSGLVVENLPNSVPGLAGGLAGGAAGTSVAGPAGSFVGGLAGGTAGGYLVEQGGSLIEQASKAVHEAGADPKDKAAVRAVIEANFDEMLKASRLKGVGTAGTDALINVLTLGVFGATERALAKAARQIEKGVKDGTIAAEQAAQSLGVVAAKQAARNTLGRKTLRGAGVVAAEGLGEGASEAAGQKLAYGEVDPLDVVMESVAGVGMGVGTAAARGTYQKIIGQDNNSSVNTAIEGAQAAIDGSKTGPSESQQRAKAAFGPTADPETAKLQEQDKARIALALSSLDDAELDAATTHLAGGDQQFKQLLSQLARDENALNTSQSVYAGGTQEYVNVADGIRRDAGITETDTGTTDTTTAVANSVRQQQSAQQDQSGELDQFGEQQPSTNSAGFYAEPLSQLKAQLLALGDGKKSGVVMGEQEAAQLDLSGFSVANVVDPETGATAVFVGRDDPSVQAAVTRADEVGLKQAAGEFLGYSNPTGTSAPTENMVAVQQLDESGNVIQEEAVTAEQAAGVSRIPGAQVRVVPLQQAMAERQQRLQQEQPTAVESAQTAPPTQQQAADQQPGTTAVGAQPATEAPLRSQGTGTSTVTKRVKNWVASFNKSIGQDPASDTAVDDGSIREFTPPKTSSLTQIAQSIKEAFGVNVMYVETPKGGLMRRDGTVFNKFNGFVDPATNTLVMHVDAATPLNTFGHELAHLMKTRFPEIYAKLELTVLSRVSAKQSAEFRAGLQKSLQEEGNPADIEQEFRDELVAESIGEMTQDPAFWKDVFSQLGEDGAKAKTLYDTVMEMISKLAQKFTKNKYVPGVKDMQKVRRAATDAFVEWSAATQNRNNLGPFSSANLAQMEKSSRLKPPEQKAAETKKVADFPETLDSSNPLLTNTVTINTPERIAMRQSIIDSYFEGRKPVSYGKPRLILLGGGGGVGKSTILEFQQKNKMIPKDQDVIKINADDIKLLLPEYRKIRKAKDWRAATTVHDESSLLAKAILYRGLGMTSDQVAEKFKPYLPSRSGGKFDLLLDATMSNKDDGLTLIKSAQKNGYFVSMNGVIADPKSAIQRAIARGKRSGRFVDPKVLAKAHAGFLDAIPLYSNVLDQLSLFDNEVARGENAKELEFNNEQTKRIIDRFRQSAKQVQDNARATEEQSKDKNPEIGGNAGVGRTPRADEADGDRGRQEKRLDGLGQFSRQNILAVTQGNRIAPMAVLDKPTESMAKTGLNYLLPIRMEQSVVEKLLTGKDGLRRKMTVDEIVALKDQISTPVAIFNDPTDKGSVVVMTRALVDGEPVVVAINKTPIDRTYNIDSVDSLGRKTQGASTERAKFSPLKTAYSKDLSGILNWIGRAKITHFDLALATKSFGKDLARLTNEMNMQSIKDKAYRVKAAGQPLASPAYDSAPSASTLGQQEKELARPAESSVTQPARIGANTLTLRKKLDSLTDTRFSRDLTSDENQDGVGIADDSNVAPDVLHGRNGVVEKNRRWMSGDRKGQYIGAPDAYNTPGKIVKLRSMFRDLAKEGIRGRFWYEESGKAVLKFVGGNSVEARKFISLLAIYSPQAKVNANTTMALSAWEQYKSGQPIDTKTELQDGQATDVLYNNKQWGGEKTNNFYKNLMREVDLAVGHPTKQGATIDMWMMRAAGYESDAPTAAQYRFVENETNLLAKELGWEPQQVQAAIWAAIKARTENKGVKQRTEAKSTKKGFMQMVMGPKGKPVRQINDAAKHRALWLKEAFGHEVTEDDTTQAIYHFGTALGERSAQLSWEATPGASTGVLPGIFAAPVSQQREYLKAIQEALQDENGHDLIDKQIGLLVDAGMMGNSGWNGEVSVGVQQQAPVYIKDGAVSQLSRNLVELSLAIRGLVLKQEGMAWHMPIWGGPQYENNGVEFNIGRQLNSRETAVLYKALSVELGHTYAPPIPTKTGFRVLNFPKTKFLNMAEEKTKLRIKRIQKVGKKRNDAFHKAVDAAVSQQDWASEVTESPHFHSDGNLIENDWGKGDEDYRRAISEKSGAHSVGSQSSGAKRPDLLKWVDDELVPRVNRVNERFAEKYGWGEPTRFSRTADAAPAVRLAEPAGRPSVGSSPGERGSTVAQAIHYGRQEGLSFLSGASFGTGIKGAEQERLSLPGTDPRIKRRVYFYLPVPGGIPAAESGLGGNVYAADLTRIYDPDGSVKGSGSAFESAVLDAGYRGYMNREQGTAVVLGEDVPVSFLGSAAQFNKVQRLIQRAIPKVATRTEGAESVRRMDSTISLDAKTAAKEAAPSFKLEYGEARVKTEQKDAANAALAGAGSQFQFSRANLDGAPLEISIGNATLKIKDAGDAVRTLEAKIKKHEQLLSCLG